MEAPTDSYSAAVEVHMFLAEDPNAIYSQLMDVAERNPDRVREFACRAAREVAMAICPHGDKIPHLIEGTIKQSRAVSIAADGGQSSPSTLMDSMHSWSRNEHLIMGYDERVKHL